MDLLETVKKQASFSIDSILSQKMNNKNNNNTDIADAFRLEERFTTLPPLISRFGGRAEKRAVTCDCSNCEQEDESLYNNHPSSHSIEDVMVDGERYFTVSPSRFLRDDSIEDSHYFFKENNNNNNNDRYNKRRRTIFTSSQLERLEFEFQQQQYIVGQERCLLARQLGLNEIQVKVWFQNRRIKWRKFTSPGSSPMPEISL